MESYDISHLPQAVHAAVLRLLETLVQAVPLAPAEAVLVHGPSAESALRFPRSATELRVLETLAALAPMPATPPQVATMVHKPLLEIRTILQSLAALGTIQHPAKGLYRHGLPADEVRLSTHFAAEIATICGMREAERA